MEIVNPSLYSTFPSQGISIINPGASGLKSGVVAANTFNFGSTISPAIAYNSAGHLFSSGIFGSTGLNGFVAGGPIVEGISAVTPAPALSEASVVTAAPSVVTAAPSVVTAAPSVVTAAPSVVTASPYPFGSGIVSGSVLDGGLVGGAPWAYSGLNAGLYGGGKFSKISILID